MPIYEAMCKKCNCVVEYYNSVENCHITPECCGGKTEKIILNAPATKMDIQPWDNYISPATGKLITSYSERREDMKVSGCRDWEGLASEQQIAKRCINDEAKKEDAFLDKAIGEVWSNMDHSKKQTLLNA